MTTTEKTSLLTGSYRTPDGEALIEWELRQEEHGPEFSAMGEHDGSAGQCLESIAAAYPQDEKVQRIVKVWRVYHLNDMKAGTPAQMAELERCEEVAKRKHPEAVYPDGTVNWHQMGKAYGFKGEHFAYYDLACIWLKRAKLYEVPVHQEIARGELKCTGGFPPEVVTGARGYRYGERWVYASIPESVLAEIRSWSDFARTDGKSLGELKAEEFLKRHGITLRLVRGNKVARWQPAGRHYSVTLGRSDRHMTFDLWGSVHDREKNIDPTPYTILACCASDIDCPSTFKEFCSEYGYDIETKEQERKAEVTFRRCYSLARDLKAFFTSEQEREQLAEIR